MFIQQLCYPLNRRRASLNKRLCNGLQASQVTSIDRCHQVTTSRTSTRVACWRPAFNISLVRVRSFRLAKYFFQRESYRKNQGLSSNIIPPCIINMVGIAGVLFIGNDAWAYLGVYTYHTLLEHLRALCPATRHSLSQSDSPYPDQTLCHKVQRIGGAYLSLQKSTCA